MPEHSQIDSNQASHSFGTQIGLPAIEDQVETVDHSLSEDYLKELEQERTRIENILHTQGYSVLPEASSTLVWSRLDTENIDPQHTESSYKTLFTQVVTTQDQSSADSISMTIDQHQLPSSTLYKQQVEQTIKHTHRDDSTADLSFGHVLGIGGSGYVQQAWQHALEREVAVKRIAGEWHTSNKAKALVEEARLAGSLEHPNIIPIHLLAQNKEGEPLIVMKKVEGESWSQSLHRDGALYHANHGERLVKHLRIFIQVCRALEYTHSRSVLHLDIKPDNIMIGSYGEVYVVDWGVGMHEKKLETLSQHYIAGTPSFMASEMVQGLKYCSKASDIALLGSTLHYLLMGDYRYRGKDIVNVLYHAGKAEPYSYPFEVHTEIAHIINKACHKDPAQRFESVYDLRCAIEDYLDHRVAFTLFSESFGMLQSLEKEIFTAFEAPQVEAFREKALTCRLTLAHTLRIWPDYQDALRSVQSLLRLCCSFEIQQQNLSVAETYYNELEEKDPKLYQQLAEAQAYAHQQLEEHQRLLTLEKEMSFTANNHWQWICIILNGLLWSSTLSTFSYLSRNHIIEMTPELNLYMSTWALIVILSLTIVLRSFFVDTTWLKNFTLVFLMYIFTLYANRYLSIWLNLSFQTSLLYDAIFFTFFLSVSAIFIHPLLWITVFTSMITIYMIPHYSEWALDGFAFTTLLANLLVAFVLKRTKVQS